MYYYGYSRRRRRRTGPKKVKNGIKVRAKRGDLGQSWLAKEWMSNLEAEMYASDPYSTGRTYARKGQVLSVNVEKGSVVAMVQGTASKPYRMVMKVGIPGAEYWKRFAEMLRKKPAYAAAILSGEMPSGVATELASRRCDLFPRGSELNISCQCQRWGVCKHAIAACYILAEEFDRDPLLYLKIRGVDREEFLAMLYPATPDTTPDPSPPVVPADTPRITAGRFMLGALRNIFSPDRNTEPGPVLPPSPDKPTGAELRPARGGADATVSTPSPDTPTEEGRIMLLGGVVPGFHIPVLPDVLDGDTQLPADPRKFWGRRGKEADSYESALAPAEPAALPKALGRFPMWRGSDQFIALIEEIYSQASLTGANAYLGIRKGASSKK